MEMIRIHMRMPRDMYQFLQDEKNETGDTINSIMNRIIGDFIFSNLDLLTGDQRHL